MAPSTEGARSGANSRCLFTVGTVSPIRTADGERHACDKQTSSPRADHGAAARVRWRGVARLRDRSPAEPRSFPDRRLLPKSGHHVLRRCLVSDVQLPRQWLQGQLLVLAHGKLRRHDVGQRRHGQRRVHRQQLHPELCRWVHQVQLPVFGPLDDRHRIRFLRRERQPAELDHRQRPERQRLQGRQLAVLQLDPTGLPDLWRCSVDPGDRPRPEADARQPELHRRDARWPPARACQHRTRAGRARSRSADAPSIWPLKPRRLRTEKRPPLRSLFCCPARCLSRLRRALNRRQRPL
mmetsp:Transcript_16913/g.40191  ORF Transcript_16913/g.40191 Transcript_16913/m.40191 type:complete len:295 (-) Transcript_16913:4112-4996(-)